MQITNHVANRPITTDVPFDLKNGEIYSAGIKERLSDKEAVLQIRGKEVIAQFEDKVPTGERATVQVTGQQDQKMTVKEIAVSSTQVSKKSTELSQILQKVGLTGKETPELRDAVKLLFDKGAPLSKEIVSELKTFFEKAGGSTEAKADTVKALVNKGLEVTQTHLRSIHEALHGKPLNEVLNNIAKELNLDVAAKEKPVVAVRPTQSEVPLQQAGKMPSVSQSNSVGNQASSRAGAAEVISSIRSMIEKEQDLQKALASVKELIANNPKVDREIAKQIEKVAGDAEKLQSIGKDRIIQALRNAEAQLGVKEQQPVESKATVVRNPVSQDLDSVVRELKNEVRTNPNLQRSIDRVITEVLKNHQLPRESAEKMERAVNEAASLLKQGRVTAGREVLTKALANLENEVVEMKRNETAPRLPVEGRPNDTSNRAPVESRPVELVNRQLAESRSVELNKRQQSDQSRASEVIRQVKEAVQQEPRLQKAVEQVRDQIINNPKIDREVAQKIERAVQEATQLQKLGHEGAGRERLAQALASAEVEMKQVEASRTETTNRQPAETRPVEPANRQPVESRPVETTNRQPIAESRPVADTNTRQQVDQSRASEVIRQVREAVQQEPRLQKAVEQVRDQIINNPKIDREVAQKIERAVQEATQLQKLGHEGAGRERLAQALASAEVEMKQAEASRTETTNRQPTETRPVEPANRQPVESRPVETNNRQPAVESRPVETTNRQPIAESRPVADTNTRQQVDQSRASEVIRQVREVVQQEPRLQKAVEQVRDQIINNPKIDREVAQKIERVVQEATQLQKLGHEGAGRERLAQALASAEVEMKQAEASRTETTNRQPVESRPVETNNRQPAVESRPVETTNRQSVAESRPVADTSTRQQAEQSRASEVIRQVKEAVQQEPRLQKVVEQVRDQIINNPKIDREVSQKIERAVQEATQLQKLGHEGAGRERLAQALASAEVEMKQVEASRTETSQRQPAETRPVEPANRQPVESRPVETTNRQSPAPSQDSALRDSIKQIREQLQSEPDLKKVLPKIQEQIINNKNIDPEVARDIEKAANQANQLNDAGRERLMKLLQQIETNIKQVESQQNVSNPKTTIELTEQNGKQVAQTQGQQAATKLEQQGQVQPIPVQKLPSETLQQALKQFQSQSDIDKALELVRKEVSSNPNIDMDNVSKIEKALDNAQQLSDRGREIAARQQVTKELTDIQQSLAKSEPKTNSAQTASTQYDMNELLQSMQVQSKDILVTRVTQKLAEATQEFRNLKREITRTLDSVQRTIDLFKGSSIPQASKMLETAISKLDNAILKSDMMLFTDMKQEKQLLQASSQLAEAKKLLAKGNFSEASKIVGQVKDLIDKINFKPTDQKVMHYVGKESLAMENRNHALETAARGYTMPEPSAKQMYEMVRSMGLNHDSDLANSLVFKNGEQAQQEQNQQNMKAVLMKLQQEEAGTRVAQQAEQALNNLTGQQLLSKADGNGTMQSMLFNLPLLLGGDPRNLQVFVNSKNEGQQVDWENCNLYFLIETKKLGDVGIMLTSTERNLSITIKNDKPGFKEKMEPIASVAKEKLKEIGYNVSGLHFTRMTPIHTETRTDQTIDQTPQKPIFTEKGLDFKI